MKQLTVQIDEADFRELKKKAADADTSIAAIVRRLIANYLKELL